MHQQKTAAVAALKHIWALVKETNLCDRRRLFKKNIKNYILTITSNIKANHE